MLSTRSYTITVLLSLLVAVCHTAVEDKDVSEQFFEKGLQINLLNKNYKDVKIQWSQSEAIEKFDEDKAEAMKLTQNNSWEYKNCELKANLGATVHYAFFETGLGQNQGDPIYKKSSVVQSIVDTPSNFNNDCDSRPRNKRWSGWDTFETILELVNIVIS